MLDFDHELLLRGLGQLRSAFLKCMLATEINEIERAQTLTEERRDFLAKEIDRQLRVYEPRMNRVEADVSDVRRAELLTNMERFARHQTGLKKLLEAKTTAFQHQKSEMERELATFLSQRESDTAALAKAPSLPVLQSVQK
eukprot:120839_1